MFYLISGKILSVLVFLLIFKLFNFFPDLILLEKAAGWFLVDHILEAYSYTASKFFLVNEDFRSLVKNLIGLACNVWCFAHQLTPLKCLYLMFSLGCVFFFLTNTNLHTKSKVLVTISYLYILYMCLIVNVYFIFYVFKFLLCFYIFCVILSLYCYLINLVLTLECSINSVKQFLLMLIIKVLIYMFLILVLGALLFNLVCIFCDTGDNCLLEGIFKLLIPYSYLYFLINLS